MEEKIDHLLSLFGEQNQVMASTPPRDGEFKRVSKRSIKEGVFPTPEKLPRPQRPPNQPSPTGFYNSFAGLQTQEEDEDEEMTDQNEPNLPAPSTNAPSSPTENMAWEDDIPDEALRDVDLTQPVYHTQPPSQTPTSTSNPIGCTASPNTDGEQPSLTTPPVLPKIHNPYKKKTQSSLQSKLPTKMNSTPLEKLTTHNNTNSSAQTPKRSGAGGEN